MKDRPFRQTSLAISTNPLNFRFKHGAFMWQSRDCYWHLNWVKSPFHRTLKWHIIALSYHACFSSWRVLIASNFVTFCNRDCYCGECWTGDLNSYGLANWWVFKCAGKLRFNVPTFWLLPDLTCTFTSILKGACN